VDLFEPAPTLPTPNAQSIEVRLMHRRLRLEMGKRVVEQKSLFLDVVEIIRSPNPENEL